MLPGLLRHPTLKEPGSPAGPTYVALHSFDAAPAERARVTGDNDWPAQLSGTIPGPGGTLQPAMPNGMGGMMMAALCMM